MTTKEKTKPVCENCQSSYVLVDAYAAWDSENQRYELSNTMGGPWVCESDKCNGDEVSVEWVDA